MIKNIKKILKKLKSSIFCNKLTINEEEKLNTKKRIPEKSEDISINFNFFNTLNEEENIFAFIIDKNNQIIEVIFYNNKVYKNSIVELKTNGKNNVLFIKSKKIYSKEYKIVFFTKDYFNEKFNSNIKITFKKNKKNIITLNKKIKYDDNFSYIGELNFNDKYIEFIVYYSNSYLNDITIYDLNTKTLI